METIPIADAIEALEEFGYECSRDGDRLLVNRNGATVAILSEPVPFQMINQLIENLGL